MRDEHLTDDRAHSAQEQRQSGDESQHVYHSVGHGLTFRSAPEDKVPVSAHLRCASPVAPDFTSPKVSESRAWAQAITARFARLQVPSLGTRSDNGAMFQRRRVEIKNAEQLALMRRAGLVVADALRETAAAVRPGVATAHLDAIAAQVIRDAGAQPSFLGYYGFPATICVSVNDEVVHGIPGTRVITDGDLVSIDCGAIVQGWHGDAAVSVPVGEVDPAVLALSDATRESLWAGIAAARVGATLGDVGHAIASSVAAAASQYAIVAGYTGHAIGSQMHMDPNVPNTGRPGRGMRLQAGMAIAIEPMVSLDGADTWELDDGWTVVTESGAYAAHWEHTVAITPAGPWVTTDPAGGGLSDEAALASI